MKTKDILAAISNGSVLCMGYQEDGKVYWLEPKRLVVRSSQAEQIIPMLKPGGDRLFDDYTSQTWTAK